MNHCDISEEKSIINSSYTYRLPIEKPLYQLIDLVLTSLFVYLSV